MQSAPPEPSQQLSRDAAAYPRMTGQPLKCYQLRRLTGRVLMLAVDRRALQHPPLLGSARPRLRPPLVRARPRMQRQVPARVQPARQQTAAPGRQSRDATPQSKLPSSLGQRQVEAVAAPGRQSGLLQLTICLLQKMQQCQARDGAVRRAGLRSPARCAQYIAPIVGALCLALPPPHRLC